MTYYCPYCHTQVMFPNLDASTDFSVSDLESQRMQKLAEKPTRCPNSDCAKFLVKSECDQKL